MHQKKIVLFPKIMVSERVFEIWVIKNSLKGLTLPGGMASKKIQCLCQKTLKCPIRENEKCCFIRTF